MDEAEFLADWRRCDCWYPVTVIDDAPSTKGVEVLCVGNSHESVGNGSSAGGTSVQPSQYVIGRGRRRVRLPVFVHVERDHPNVAQRPC